MAKTALFICVIYMVIDHTGDSGQGTKVKNKNTSQHITLMPKDKQTN